MMQCSLHPLVLCRGKLRNHFFHVNGTQVPMRGSRGRSARAAPGALTMGAAHELTVSRVLQWADSALHGMRDSNRDGDANVGVRDWDSNIDAEADGGMREGANNRDKEVGSGMRDGDSTRDMEEGGGRDMNGKGGTDRAGDRDRERGRGSEQLVLLRTRSPRHFLGGDWNTGGGCHNIHVSLPLAPSFLVRLFGPHLEE